ncbi:MAG: hypothetical protein IT569_07555 [Leptospiraceae bacterium]|nr:hypothetical protein [Leptospiraceae bacterium]
MRNDILKLYAWIAVPSSVIAIPALFTFPVVFGYSEYLDAFGLEKFAYKFFFTSLTWSLSALIYFWPLILSIRKPKILSVSNGSLSLNKKKYNSKEIRKCELRKTQHTTRHGSSSYVTTVQVTRSYYLLSIEFQDGTSFFETFTSNSRDELVSFVKFLGEKLLIKTEIIEI